MRRRSATWTACCRPRTSRAPMPSSSVGRPRRTCPSRVCQRRACTSCSPARRPIRRCTRPSRPMRGGPCANTSGTRTSMPRTAPCRAASPCSRWAAPARRMRRWCSTIWPWRTASINPCMAVMSKAISTPMASPGRRSRTCWPAPAISSICGTARPTRSGSPTRTAWAGCWRRAGASRATPLPRSRRCARISWASASTRRHSGPRAMRSGASRRTRIAAAR